MDEKKESETERERAREKAENLLVNKFLFIFKYQAAPPLGVFYIYCVYYYNNAYGII